MNRSKLRAVIAFAAALLATSAIAGETISVFKTSGCGCCLAWAKHLEKAGYTVTAKNLAMGDLMQMKLKAHIPLRNHSPTDSQIGEPLRLHLPGIIDISPVDDDGLF